MPGFDSLLSNPQAQLGYGLLLAGSPGGDMASGMGGMMQLIQQNQKQKMLEAEQARQAQNDQWLNATRQTQIAHANDPETTIGKLIAERDKAPAEQRPLYDQAIKNSTEGDPLRMLTAQIALQNSNTALQNSNANNQPIFGTTQPTQPTQPALTLGGVGLPQTTPAVSAPSDPLANPSIAQSYLGLPPKAQESRYGIETRSANKTLDSADAQAQNASGIQSRIQEAQTALPDAYTGAFAPLKTSLANFGAILPDALGGADFKKRATATQTVESNVNALTSQVRSPGEGSISNFERDLYKSASSAGSTGTLEAKQKAFEAMNKLQELHKGYDDFLTAYAAANRGLTRGAAAKWNKFVEDTKGGDTQDWQSYFKVDGGQFAPTPAAPANGASGGWAIRKLD